jgi:hypothetical protein
MRIKESICFILLTITLSSCLTPSKLIRKSELDNLIVSNIERDLLIGDTLILNHLI